MLNEIEFELKLLVFYVTSTILQLYMWRHSRQADWRRSYTYGRAPNAIDIS